MKTQKGFTLIELIIVIVVLGILAVTAAPQFFNFAGDAKQSAVSGLKGAVQGAAQVTFARAAIDDQLGASETVEGITTEYGYPTADATGIVVAAQLSADQISATEATTEYVFNTIAGTGTDQTIHFTLSSVISSAATVGSTTISDTNCYVSYKETTSSNTPPVITSTTSGC